jgi:acetyl/propionyl-CoA carboxylase alpha subunit
MSLIHRPFRRVGVVNRGEAAVRFLRAARAWSKRHREPMEVVALYTHPDRDAIFVREADEAMLLGDALVPGPPARCAAPTSTCLGWCRCSSRPAATPSGRAGASSPSARLRRRLRRGGPGLHRPVGRVDAAAGRQDRRQARGRDNGVPVTPWSGGPVVDAARPPATPSASAIPCCSRPPRAAAGEASASCGPPTSSPAAFASASAEARAAFGDPTLLVESFAPEARHVEVQVIADAHGRVHAVGTRDCSMQRRHQKVLEEAPAPGLGALEERSSEAAVRIARASGYVNAGTAEFLVRPDLSGFYFLEMNTRLQVEHPVTECVTGLDLVGMQIDVARGESAARVAAPRPRPRRRGEAQRRGPRRGLPPQRGAAHRFELATGPGVRVDSGFVAGDVVPGEFDSMLAKVIAFGPTREEALARLEEALARSTVAIEGGASNRSPPAGARRPRRLPRGPVTTRWLDQHIAASAPAPWPARTSTEPWSRPPSGSTSAPAPTRSPR